MRSLLNVMRRVPFSTPYPADSTSGGKSAGVSIRTTWMPSPVFEGTTA